MAPTCGGMKRAPETAGRTMSRPQESSPAIRLCFLTNCTPPPAFTPPNQVKTHSLLACMAWRKTNVDPTGCTWTQPPPQP